MWCGQKKKKKEKKSKKEFQEWLDQGWVRKKKKLTMTGLVLGVGILKNSVHSKLLQSFPTLRDPMDCSLTGSSGQEYWSGLPCPLPGDLPDPGIEHVSLMSPALTGR